MSQWRRSNKGAGGRGRSQGGKPHAQVDGSKVDEDNQSNTSVEDTEDAQGEEQQGREYEYTTSISEEQSKCIGEFLVEDENAGVIALGGGEGMMLPQEALATTTKEEGAEAATALGMATVVKGDDAIGDRSCKAALVEENPKEEIGPWPADVNNFFTHRLGSTDVAV